MKLVNIQPEGFYIVSQDACSVECDEKNAVKWAVFSDKDHCIIASGFASFVAAENWINTREGEAA